MIYVFKKIVVGIGLDPGTQQPTVGSLKAAEQARWVAQANQGRILYVHSTFSDEYYDLVDGRVPVCQHGLADTGRQALEELLEETRRAGIEADLEVTVDRIWLDITRKALRNDADLVVVGKREEPTSEARKLGAIATKLIRKCPAPIWVVKPDHDLVQRLVLAASDLTPVGDQACRCAAYVAKRHGCDLSLVHAYQIPFQLQMEAARISEVEYDERVERMRERATRHMRESVAEIWGADDKELQVHVGKGTPSTIIREAVAHLDPDLLVMGSISHGGLAGLLLGSTAERLLDRLDCSILAVKPEDFVSPVQLEDAAGSSAQS